MMMWKIVGGSKASVLYIYIDKSKLYFLQHFHAFASKLKIASFIFVFFF